MSNKKLRTVRFKATYWSFEEIEDDEEHKCIIHISGLTKNQKTVQVKVEGFTPFVYLELPKRIKWNRAKCKALFQYFGKLMKEKGPISFAMHTKYLLYYKKRINTMFMSFPTFNACRAFGNKCNYLRNIYIPGVGTFRAGELKVHEHNIDPIIKFAAVNKIKLAGWISVKEHIPEDEVGLSIEERRFATTDIDMYADWQDVKPFERKNVVTHPKYCSFDIECYSDNHNSKLPDPKNPKNLVFQISMVFGRLNDPRCKKKKILLTLHDPHDIKGVDVIRCKHEKELLLRFSSIIIKEDPGLFIGYNIMKFDWDYMIVRAGLVGGFYRSFMKMSRLIGEKAVLSKSSWSSAAYGLQVFQYPNCHGRTNVDIILEVERNFKLPKYSLNYVSEYFLGEQKDDVTPRQLFMSYQATDEILPELQRIKRLTPKKLKYYKHRIKNIFPIRKSHGVIKNIRRRLLNASTKNFKSILRELLTTTGKYCVQDTILPIRLEEKLNLWTTMEQMSNIMAVPPSYLHTRGQQIKVLAQVYNETLWNNIVIPYADKNKEHKNYQGAIVIEANPGYYKRVGTLDFASLYPTVMIAYNICYTTILEDNDPTPDEECHVLEWIDHRKCEHDLNRKKKTGAIICGPSKYRFKRIRVRIEKDGSVTYENEGLMPRLERKLLLSRKEVKKEMFKVEARLKMQRGQATEDEIKYYKSQGWEIIEKGSLSKKEEIVLDVMRGVLNAKQLAIKVSCNSIYGGYGAKMGFFPFIPGAASVTAMGRRLIMMAIDKIRKTWKNCKLVYGDSVTGDTPILCRYKGNVFYKRINDLGKFSSNWTSVLDKQYSTPYTGIEVWSDKGFTPIRNIIRHKTNKKIYRVTMPTGSVCVTEDHSLLDNLGNKVRPKDVKIGDKLLTKCLPPIKNSTIQVSKIIDNFGKGLNIYSTQIAAAKHYRLLSSSSESVIIETNKTGYKLLLEDGPISDPSSIIKIEEISKELKEEFVYDLETENHHFAAGVGQLIVHNTDSCMIYFEGCDIKRSFELCEEAGEVSTHYLKSHILGVSETFTVKAKIDGKYVNIRLNKISSKSEEYKTLKYDDKIRVLEYEMIPIDLEFENMYGEFLLLSKKRYLAHIMNRKGEVIGKQKKGVVLARRDNSEYLRITYKQMTDKILDDKSEEDVMESLYSRVHKLFTRRIPDTQLIIYTGVKTIINYAKTEKKKIGYNRYEEYFIDSDGERFEPYPKNNSQDPRLVYPNYPQVLLALKMIRRGTNIPGNTRLEYLYIQNPNAIHQGEKAEDYTYYKENKDIENLKPDQIHYIEKQLTNPISELLRVKYPRGEVLYEKLEDALRRVLGSNNISSLKRNRIFKTRRFVLTISNDTNKSLSLVGWDTLRHNIRKDKRKRDRKSYTNWFDIMRTQYPYINIEKRKYNYRNNNARVMHVIESSKKDGRNEFNYKKEVDAEIINVCKRWRSRFVLDKIYKQAGMKKRPAKRPSQSGEKLRLNTEIMLIVPIDNCPKLSKGKVIALEERGTWTKKSYYYTLKMRNGKTLEKVPRNTFNTYYLRDSTIMKDIMLARKYYMQIVKHLNELFKEVEEIRINFEV